MKRHKKPSHIMKTSLHQPRKELEFELAYQRSLTLRERFKMMEQSSREMLQQLLENGHLKPIEVIKRS